MADLSQIIGEAVELLEAQRTALLQESNTARIAINSAIEGLSAFERGVTGLTAERTRQAKQAERVEAKRIDDARKAEEERAAALLKKHTEVAEAKAKREAEEKEAEAFLKSRKDKSK